MSRNVRDWPWTRVARGAMRATSCTAPGAGRGHKAAVDALQNSVDLGGETPHNWLFIAMSQRQLGNQERAQSQYEKSSAWREKNKLDEELETFFSEAERLFEPEEKENPTEGGTS